jgi:hypothetical protein
MSGADDADSLLVAAQSSGSLPSSSELHIQQLQLQHDLDDGGGAGSAGDGDGDGGGGSDRGAGGGGAAAVLEARTAESTLRGLSTSGVLRAQLLAGDDKPTLGAWGGDASRQEVGSAALLLPPPAGTQPQQKEEEGVLDSGLSERLLSSAGAAAAASAQVGAPRRRRRACTCLPRRCQLALGATAVAAVAVLVWRVVWVYALDGTDISLPDGQRLRGGLIGAGSDGAKARVWRGVPFAASPVNERRWLPPLPPERWQVRACVRACVFTRAWICLHARGSNAVWENACRARWMRPVRSPTARRLISLDTAGRGIHLRVAFRRPRTACT